MCVHAGDGQTYLARVDGMLRLSYQDTGLHVSSMIVRKSSYKQASISLICHGLVPQSHANTATSKSPETHLKRVQPNAMHSHTHTTSTPWPLYHACVPWYLVMKVLLMSKYTAFRNMCHMYRCTGNNSPNMYRQIRLSSRVCVSCRQCQQDCST